MNKDQVKGAAKDVAGKIQEGAGKLVGSKSQQAKPDPDAHFETIVIKTDGSCLLGSRTVPLNRMKAALAVYASEAKPPVFRIRMDAKATAQQFISVMDALKQNNLSKVTFDTEAK